MSARVGPALLIAAAALALGSASAPVQRGAAPVGARVSSGSYGSIRGTSERSAAHARVLSDRNVDPRSGRPTGEALRERAYELSGRPTLEKGKGASRVVTRGTYGSIRQADQIRKARDARRASGEDDNPMTFETTQTGYQRVVAGGRAVYYKDGTFYRTSFRGGAFSYVAIGAPLGAEVDALPANCSEFVKDGVAYVRCGDTVFEKVFDGEAVRYRVVADP